MRLEKTHSGFLWGRGVSTHKPHLVNWSIWVHGKTRKGFELKNVSILNKALLGNGLRDL